MPLTPLELDILTFERENTHWAYEAHRETAIRERFGMSREEYGLVLVRLLRRPESEAHDPFTVRRLRSIIEARRR